MSDFTNRKINRIAELDSQIYDYYQSLITLEETKDKRDDYERRKNNLSAFIERLIREEIEEYSYYIGNPDIALATYIKLAKNAVYNSTPLDAINDPNKDKLITRRIMTTFENIITSDKSMFRFLINKKLIEKIRFPKDTDDTLLEYLFREVPLINESFDKTLYTLLDEDGNHKAKMNLCFISPAIERILIPSKFEPFPKKLSEDISLNTMVSRIQKEIFMDSHIGEKIDEALDTLEDDEDNILFTYFKAGLVYQSPEAIKDLSDFINASNLSDHAKERLLYIIKNNSKTKKELSQDDNLLYQRMNAYQLNHDDIKNLKDFLELENAILNGYRGLANLEIKELTNSVFYKNITEILVLYKEQEEAYLNYFRKNRTIIPNVIEYLIDTINDSIPSPVKLILTYVDNEDVVFSYRALQLLKNVLFESDKAFESNLDDDIKEIVPDYHQKITSVKDYERRLSNEANKRIISFLNEKNDKETIKQKYYMGYLCPDLEDEFISCKGHFPKNFTAAMTVNNDLLEEEKSELQITFGLDVADCAIDCLLDYYDSDIEAYPHETALLLNMLRSALLFLDETEKKILLEDLEEEFKDEDYLAEHEDDEEIRDLIRTTIKESKQDFKEMNKATQKDIQ